MTFKLKTQIKQVNNFQMKNGSSYIQKSIEYTEYSLFKNKYTFYVFPYGTFSSATISILDFNRTNRFYDVIYLLCNRSQRIC